MFTVLDTTQSGWLEEELTVISGQATWIGERVLPARTYPTRENTRQLPG
jgi:hypothetical protein